MMIVSQGLREFLFGIEMASLVALIALGAVCLLHGTANTLDTCAYRLHRAARLLRESQEARKLVVTSRWVRELEG